MRLITISCVLLDVCVFFLGGRNHECLVCVCLCVRATVTSTDLWSDRANLPSYCPALLVLSCSKWLSDQLALKLNTLTDLEENQNQFVPRPSIWSRPPGARELVTSPWCGIDVLTCKVRLKKRLRERIRQRERERKRMKLSIPPAHFHHFPNQPWDQGSLGRVTAEQVQSCDVSQRCLALSYLVARRRVM